jgi:hypothetical protein
MAHLFAARVLLESRTCLLRRRLLLTGAECIITARCFGMWKPPPRPLSTATRFPKSTLSQWSSSSNDSDPNHPLTRHGSPPSPSLQELETERALLLKEAKFLTQSLYRCIVRSVRVIRHGNHVDETEFQRREAQRQAHLEANATSISRGNTTTTTTTTGSTSGDVRLSMLSLLPPVDRVDELRSRAEYYQQYAREHFVQESDCLDRDEWQDFHLARYLHLLQRGEEQRQWLLADMKFPDPFAGRLQSGNVQRTATNERIGNFEQRARQYIQNAKYSRMQKKLSPVEFDLYVQYLDRNTGTPTNDRSQGVNEANETDDGWSTDEDEDDTSTKLPPWYTNP